MLLKIASKFSTAPGPRHRSEGLYSGQQFREDLLLPRLRRAIEAEEKLTVDLDGTSGYGTSFLEESFGGLIRENDFSLATVDEFLEFVSEEEPDLLTEIRGYMVDAEKERLKRGGRA